MYVQAVVRPENTLAQQAIVACLLDGYGEPLDGKGVFRAAVDIALARADGIAGDDHAFQYGMGVGLKDRAVHKSARIAFVGIAQDIFHVAFGLAGKRPLHACGKTAAAAAAQARCGHFGNDLVGLHFKQGFGRTHIAVAGYVFIDFFSVDKPAVFKGYEHLLAEKGDIVNMGNGLFRYGLVVHEPLDRPPLDNMFFDDFGDIINADLLVKNSFGVHDHDGACRAESVAAGFNHEHFIGQAALCNFLHQSRVYHFAAGCLAARAATDQYMSPKHFHLSPPRESCSLPRAITNSL